MKNALTLGELAAFLTCMKLFFRPLRELSEKFNRLQSSLASAERIVTVLGNETANPASGRPTQSIQKIDSLAFEQVNFADKELTLLINCTSRVTGILLHWLVIRGLSHYN